jgi:exosortase E/protease (VPEID-CTERM system)
MTTNTIATVDEVRGRWSLAHRAALAALLLCLNKILLSYFADFDTAQTATGLGRFIRIAQHDGFRFLVTLAVATALFGYIEGNPALRQINSAARAARIRIPWLALHAALFAPLAALTFSLYGGQVIQLPTVVLTILWLATASLSALALILALAPWELWRDAAASLGKLWLYAGAAAAFAAGAMQWSQLLWAPVSQVTFEAVEHVLRPLVPTLQSDRAAQVLDTGSFAVQIAKECSGLEGAGLMLAFCGAWLLYFRKEYRFPRALIIIPAALALMFALNIVRIAALVLIGGAGFADVAIYGFHSQAGWIAFNAAACGIAWASRRSAWLTTQAPAEAHGNRTQNPTTTYLLPFLAILAMGMVSRAGSGRFETLYPLRLLAAALALLYCRKGLYGINWRFSWRAPAVGIAVFAIWLIAAHFLLSASGMPSQLAAMPPFGRVIWVASRTLAAVVTVPIAEELAYRGYLMRRIKAADFESLSLADAGWMGLLVSAVLFGVSHGSMWLPGFATGILYGWLAMRTGRLGEAIVAHATTNALVAAAVIWGQQWQLW